MRQAPFASSGSNDYAYRDEQIFAPARLRRMRTSFGTALCRPNSRLLHHRRRYHRLRAKLKWRHMEEQPRRLHALSWATGQQARSHEAPAAAFVGEAAAMTLAACAGTRGISNLNASLASNSANLSSPPIEA